MLTGQQQLTLLKEFTIEYEIVWNKTNKVNKYNFSRNNWYQAEFDDRHYFEVQAWCSQQFGPHPSKPDAWSRWWHKFQGSILFRDEKDYILFTLRWS